MTITHLIFDLDDTLYPAGNGLWADIGDRINLYLVDRLGLTPDGANSLRRQYYQKYGTTLRGLLTEQSGTDADDYLRFVHDVDVSQYLTPDPRLAEMLAGLPQKKVIFTNADRSHADRVLDRLGLHGMFDPIVDIRAMKFYNKPLPQSYAALFEQVPVEPGQCLYLEDTLRNLEPAKSLGMHTLYVGPAGDPSPAVDWRAATIYEAGDIIRSLTGA